MKKTLIALALVSVSAAASADVVLYGNIRGGVEVKRNFTSKDALGVEKHGTTTNIADYGSYIGFKGHEDLNNSLRAIWQVEQNVSIGGHNNRTWATRDSFIGLAGNFGTVKAGYLSTPTKDANGRLDEWEYDDNAAGLGVFTRDNNAVKRAGAVSYTTPNFGGLTASAYVSPSDNNNADSNESGFFGDNKGNEKAIYGASVGYENSGFFGDVAGTYVKNSMVNKDGYQAVANVGYDANNWLAGVAYQQGRYVDTVASLTSEKPADIALHSTSGTNAEIKRSQEVAGTVAYTLNNNLRLKGSAAYGFGIDGLAGSNIDDAKYVQGVVGADYLLSKRTVLNGQVGYLEFKDILGKDTGKLKKGTVGVGMKHKF